MYRIIIVDVLTHFGNIQKTTIVMFKYMYSHNDNHEIDTRI